MYSAYNTPLDPSSLFSVVWSDSYKGCQLHLHNFCLLSWFLSIPCSPTASVSPSGPMGLNCMLLLFPAPYPADRVSPQSPIIPFSFTSITILLFANSLSNYLTTSSVIFPLILYYTPVGFLICHIWTISVFTPGSCCFWVCVSSQHILHLFCTAFSSIFKHSILVTSYFAALFSSLRMLR